MYLLLNIIKSIWHALGSPSIISGFLIAAISALARYTKGKLKKLDDLEKNIKSLKEDTNKENILLKDKIESLDRLLSSRIDDLKEKSKW